MIDIVIINYNTGELTCKCIESVCQNYGKTNIIVVDNCSTDNSVKMISKYYPEAKVIINSENLGYAKAVNIGVRLTKSEFVLVSNSDVEYLHNSIQIVENMMNYDPQIGVCGFNQQYPDGTAQRSYGRFPGYLLGLMDMTMISSISKRLNLISQQRENLIIYPEYADGAALILRRNLFDKLYGFDEDYFFYTEEADYCKRVWSYGYKVAINLNAKIIHHRGAGRSKSSFNEKAERLLVDTKLLFILKHGSEFEAKFFRFAQSSYFFIIYVIEYLISSIMNKPEIKDKSKEHLRIFKIWKKAKVDKKI